MLFNFCDPRLQPEIKCSTISTEGYEVTNLISDPCNGFLAYSCIKPPIDIDITFLCNIRINHILIWPSVGSQKSSGFLLFARNTNDNTTPYTLLSNGFLNACDTGLLFYPGDIDLAKISVPENFLKRYIKISMQHLTMYTQVLRITICKTDKSVPALGKIEVWGTVSSRCGKDIVASVCTLWSKHQATQLALSECKTGVTSESVKDDRQEETLNVEIPDSFLDAITWELMTQPVILPSGKVIDLTTLEKHGQNAAIWGRSLSDPFTGIPFNDDRRPVMATALKSRIDKFLLDNRNLDEVKNIPRVLGHDPTSVIAGDRRISEIPKCVLDKSSLKRTVEDSELNICKQVAANSAQQRTKRHCHKLPAVIMCPKQSTANINARSKPQTTKTLSFPNVSHNTFHNNNRDIKSEPIDIDDSLDSNTKIILSNIKHFNTPEKVELHNISNDCTCCNNSTLYRLPCRHVICRKVLLSVENNQCKYCGFSYKSSDIERIHGSISNR